VLEPFERVAHGDAAGAELARQLLLDEAPTSRQPTGEDRRAQRPVGLRFDRLALDGVKKGLSLYGPALAETVSSPPMPSLAFASCCLQYTEQRNPVNAPSLTRCACHAEAPYRA
jgi:hypothetical protein